MEQVVAEGAKVRVSFDEEAVHDLRVAVRRCRSMAESIFVLDPDDTWKKMRKAGKRLFSALGELRDIQVLAGWVQKLGAPDDPVRERLLQHCTATEQRLRDQAGMVLRGFDDREWLRWAMVLDQRAKRFELGGDLFQVLAVEKWQKARELHRAAMRNRSKISLHNLRIGIKRFRYIVENFLPVHYQQWGEDLKQLQDWLGEVHDLDVLWETALKTRVFTDSAQRARWRELITTRRQIHVQAYRHKMTGVHTLWQVWRSQLPSGPELGKAVLSRFDVWSSFFDPDPSHTRHVLRLALELYDGLEAAGLIRLNAQLRPRELLTVSALSHEIGRANRKREHHREHHKRSAECSNRREIHRDGRRSSWKLRRWLPGIIAALYRSPNISIMVPFLSRAGKRLLFWAAFCDWRMGSIRSMTAPSNALLCKSRMGSRWSGRRAIGRKPVPPSALQRRGICWKTPADCRFC